MVPCLCRRDSRAAEKRGINEVGGGNSGASGQTNQRKTMRGRRGKGGGGLVRKWGEKTSIRTGAQEGNIRPHGKRQVSGISPNDRKDEEKYVCKRATSEHAIATG